MELDGKATIALEDGTKLSAEKINGILEVKGQDGKVLPSYYEMWFSWAKPPSVKSIPEKVFLSVVGALVVLH